MSQNDGCLELVGIAILTIVFLVFGGGWWVFKSSQEAATYNKITGKQVTTWDAMWVELRIQEQVDARRHGF